MSPILYYGFTLAFFFFAFCVLGWGLNLQFGEAGILNFAYIGFVAIGAYITGVTSMGKPQPGSGQSYLFGASLPFPLNLLLGGVASCILGLFIALIVFRRLRTDYLAMVLISLSLVLYDVINNYVPLFDGAAGLYNVPEPFAGVLNLNSNSFVPFFTGVAAVIALVMWFVMSRITRSPLGRTFRAIRDDPDVASAMGKNVFRYQLTAMLIGAFYAGIGGGLLVEFSSSFSTSAWLPVETFLIFAAVIVGGVGNNKGVVLGALIVPVGFTQLPKFLPDIPGHPGLILNIDGMAIGVLLMLTLWFRPQGLLPERRRRSKTTPGGLQAGGRPSGEHDLCTAAGLGGCAMTSPTELSLSAGDDAQPALRVEDVHKSFGGVKAVNGATFNVPTGKISALIGPNGAGKTTAVNILSGALNSDAGRVLVGDIDVSGWPSYKIARLGLIRTFQLSRELEGLTVLENLLVTPKSQSGESLFNIYFRPRLVRREERANVERATEILHEYGLYDLRDNWARELSGGQKRLLELARAVMAQPRLLLLDEPMAGINPALIDRIGEHILELREEGVTVLMVEHNLNVVERICDHVIVLAEGRTLATGSMSALRDNAEVVRAYLGGVLDARVDG